MGINARNFTKYLFVSWRFSAGINWLKDLQCRLQCSLQNLYGGLTRRIYRSFLIQE
jgi:hypothetical protein